MAFLPFLSIPEPLTHDEFSYLLGADTFARGRLTNPAHPFWVHFEAPHVNPQPTYASKYPPGQSVVMALGQQLFGHPWYGVVLSFGLMSASVCWMLQGWLPPSYALLGSLLAITRFSLTSNWVDSYWGGAVAAIGGALVAGAIPRLARRPQLSASVLGALGVIILANSRPYEGLVLTFACAGALLWWMQRARRSFRSLCAPRIVIPAGAILLAGFMWMGYYNFRVTGSPWSMPYQVNNRIYAASPFFWILPEGQAPPYRHEPMRKLFAGWDRDLYVQARASPFARVEKVINLTIQVFSVPFCFLILVATILAPTQKVRVALALMGSVALGLVLEKDAWIHYYSPVLAVVLFLAVTGWRHIVFALRPRGGAARAYTVLLFAGFILVPFGIRAARAVQRTIQSEPGERQRVIDQLLPKDSRHLVLVRYLPNHNSFDEWVYNRADIDGAEIVWAHDKGETSNAAMLEYFSNRKVWLLEPDVKPPKAVPYGLAKEH